MKIVASRVEAADPIRPVSISLGAPINSGVGGFWAVNPSGGFTYVLPGSPFAPRRFDEIREAAKTFSLETIDIAELDRMGVLRSSFGLTAGPFAVDDLNALLSPDSNRLVGSIKLLDAALGAIPTENLTVTGISAIVGGADYFANLATGRLSVVDQRLGWLRPLFEIASVAVAASGSPDVAKNIHAAGQVVGVLVSFGKFAYALYEVGARSPPPVALSGQGAFSPLPRNAILVHA